jgi:two-component system response regulator AtoC
VTARPGLLEAASGGTIFFDEIGELPKALQPKLLRVLESKRALRVGGTQERELDIRVVAATNRDLAAEVTAGRFRQDLLYRLNAATVVLPPLRNRPGEIAVLARTFLADACKRAGTDGVGPKVLPGASLHLLARHPWPGNVRELKNVIEFLAATVPGAVIDPDAVRARLATVDATGAPAPAAAPPRQAEPQEAAAPIAAIAPAAAETERRATRGYVSTPPRFPAIADEIRQLEQRRIEEALEATGGVQTRAAELIGMPLRTFQQKVKLLGLGRRSPPTE